MAVPNNIALLGQDVSQSLALSQSAYSASEEASEIVPPEELEGGTRNSGHGQEDRKQKKHVSSKFSYNTQYTCAL